MICMLSQPCSRAGPTTLAAQKSYPCVIGYEFRAPTDLCCNGETAHWNIHVHDQPVHAMTLMQKDSLHIYGRVCPDLGLS